MRICKCCRSVLAGRGNGLPAQLHTSFDKAERLSRIVKYRWATYYECRQCSVSGRCGCVHDCCRPDKSGHVSTIISAPLVAFSLRNVHLPAFWSMLAELAAIPFSAWRRRGYRDIAMAHGSTPVPTTSCAITLVCQIIRMRQRLQKASMYHKAPAWRRIITATSFLAPFLEFSHGNQGQFSR